MPLISAIRFPRLLPLAILAVLSSAFAGAQKTEPTFAEVKAIVLKRMNDIMQRQAYLPGADFAKWPEKLERRRPAIDKATNADEFAQAVNGALRDFGVSHIVFSTPKAATARLEHKTVGIGVQLSPEDGGLRVMTTFEDAPAAKAGIVPGDLITEANGKKVTSPLEMTGEEGSTVILTVKRADASIKTFTLIRRKFSNVRPETLTWIDKDTAVLKIPTFDLTYNRLKVEELVKEAAMRGKGLVIDLRSNGGGAVVNLTHFLGLILPSEAPIGTFLGRRVVDNFVEETKGSPTDLSAIAKWSKDKVTPARNRSGIHFDGNIAVMVNGGSGSASEMAAAAFQELLDAPVVGTKSAGAMLVSIMSALPSGYQLQFPISDYLTIKGRRLEGAGVAPLLEVQGPIKFGDPDLAVDKAVALLHRVALREGRVGK